MFRAASVFFLLDFTHYTLHPPSLAYSFFTADWPRDVSIASLQVAKSAPAYSLLAIRMPLSCLWCISNRFVSSAEDDDTSGKPIAESSSGDVRTNGAGVLNGGDAGKLFDTYADPSSPNMMGVEGLMRLCEDSGIAFDGAQPLLLAWQLGQEEFGIMTRENWVAYLEEMRIHSLDALAELLSDLDNLIIQRKPPLIRQSTLSGKSGKSKSGKAAKDEKYLKHRLWGYAEKVDLAFMEFYNFLFKFVLRPGARVIDMEYATAFWTVSLAPQYPIMLEIIEFVNEKETYKKVSKDLWSMMPDFCRTVKPDLESYNSEEECWPSLLDDFVDWKRGKMAAANGVPNEAAPTEY